MRHAFALSTVLILSLSQSAAFAQSSPIPNRRGDYYSASSNNDAANWEVKSTKLNCRYAAASKSRVVITLSRGDTFALHSELEGSVIQLDSKRKPWLRVKHDGTGGVPCYVRANSRYIVPLVSGCGRWDVINQNCYCGVDEWDAKQQLCVAE